MVSTLPSLLRDRSRRAAALSILALVALPACGNAFSAAETGSTGTTSATGAGGSGGEGQGGGTSTGAGGQGGEAGGPVIRIHLRSTVEPFEHDDGLAGQTPLEHLSGIRSFQLFEGDDDPNPLTVFDLGKGFIEVNYTGADTVVAEVPIKSLVPGHYTRGRVVHTHVRYRIKATAHVGVDLPGEFHNLQVLSDDVTIDGKTWDHGHYDFVFQTGQQSYPTSGEGAPVPEYQAGGFSVAFDGSEWAYRFPTDLTIPADLAGDIDMVMEVNMHESFRWQDENKLGYKTGVFDVTPQGTEPVKRFGANSFSVFAE